AELVRELRLEAIQERVERAVGPVVQQAAESQARDVREAAREHLGPDLDRVALRVAEALELFLQQALDAFLRRAPEALLESAEQRAVIALREPVLELIERVVHLLARGPRLHEPRGAVALGVLRDLV